MSLIQEQSHPPLNHFLYLLLSSELIDYIGICLGHLYHLESELILNHLVYLHLVAKADLFLHLRRQNVQARMLRHRLVVTLLRGGH